MSEQWRPSYDVPAQSRIVAPLRLDDVEHRTQSGDDRLLIRGIWAPYDSWSEPIYGMFRERVMRGAFKKWLRTDPELPLLVMHQHAMIPLATTGARTMSIEDRPEGMWLEAEMRRTAIGEDHYEAVRRGDLNQASMSFYAARDRWTHKENQGELDERDILEVRSVVEISLTWPGAAAYQATDISAEGERSVTASAVERDDMAPSGVGDDEHDHAAVRRRAMQLVRLGGSQHGSARGTNPASP
jgi:HK97 family phage prohead protease